MIRPSGMHFQNNRECEDEEANDLTKGVHGRGEIDHPPSAHYKEPL